MRRVGQSRRRDQNEPLIIKALQLCGWLVQRVSEKGFPDLVLWHPARKRLLLVEVKTPKGKATQAQVETQADGWPVHTVRGVSDALALNGK